MAKRTPPRVHWGDTTGMWGTTPGERVRLILTLALVIGSPTLAVVAIDHFQFLDDRSLTAAIILFAVLIPLFFLFVRETYFPIGTPLYLRIVTRVGFALCSCALVVGVVGVANGYGTPGVARDVPCVAKRETLQRDEDRRTHYLSVRAWPGSPRVVEIPAPRDVYELASPGSDVRLIVGRGRLGLEWIKGVEASPATAAAK